jgi:hypothetical protein
VLENYISFKVPKYQKIRHQRYDVRQGVENVEIEEKLELLREMSELTKCKKKSFS